MKKKVCIIAAIAIVVAGAFWAKGYYNDRYVLADSYYTQIPMDEVNEDSWLVDDQGEKQEKGKAYELTGYNEKGEAREVHFFKRGVAEDYYAPGTYIKVDVSKTIVIGESVVEEQAVPTKALEQIQTKGTGK